MKAPVLALDGSLDLQVPSKPTSPRSAPRRRTTPT
jgi:hypothetical protein